MKTTWCALGATILLTTACSTTTPAPDPEPTEADALEAATNEAADPATAPILDASTAASIDAFWADQINTELFVPIYVGDRGVAVDGADAVRFDPETGRFADTDRKGGAGSLYIQALVPSLEAASEARAMTRDQAGFSIDLSPGIFVEPHVPYGVLVEVLYTTGQSLRTTISDADNTVSFSADTGRVGEPLKLSVRREDGWGGFNANNPGLAVGPSEGLDGIGEEPLEPMFGSEAAAAPKKPLDLTIMVGLRGIAIMAEGGALPPVEGCPADGPTLCNVEGVDAAPFIATVASTQGAERDAALGGLVALYDLNGLYTKAVQLKNASPDETVFTVTADPAIPVGVIDAVVDAVRARRGADSFDDAAAFEAAAPDTPAFDYPVDALFTDPVFGIAQ